MKHIETAIAKRLEKATPKRSRVQVILTNGVSFENAVEKALSSVLISKNYEKIMGHRVVTYYLDKTLSEKKLETLASKISSKIGANHKSQHSLTAETADRVVFNSASL